MGLFGWGKKNKAEEAADTAAETEAVIEEANVEIAEEAVENQAEEPAEMSENTEDMTPDTVQDESVDEEDNDAQEITSADTGDENTELNDAEDEPEMESEEVSDISDEPEQDEEADQPKKKGFFKRLAEGLSKTRKSISSGFGSIFSGFSKIDDDFYEELEEILITSDMGVETTEKILDDLRDKVEENKIKQPEDCKDLLIESIKAQMTTDESAYDYEKKTAVILLIGVNGVGKTTTAGKLAANYKAAGKKVLLAAADTFRAAATEQLITWSNRAGVEIVAGHDGADPASVVFDAVAAAKARHTDLLICDTAGRLHNKKNLMEELRKIYRIISKEFPEAAVETFVVVDSTTGQNALVQAKEFASVSDVTGIVLTKLDGTAKGGIAVAISSELSIPVKFIGVGEHIEDLQKFDSDSYVDAIFKVDNN